MKPEPELIILSDDDEPRQQDSGKQPKQQPNCQPKSQTNNSSSTINRPPMSMPNGMNLNNQNHFIQSSSNGPNFATASIINEKPLDLASFTKKPSGPVRGQISLLTNTMLSQV
jgi:hypothetical protein